MVKIIYFFFYEILNSLEWSRKPVDVDSPFYSEIGLGLSGEEYIQSMVPTWIRLGERGLLLLAGLYLVIQGLAFTARSSQWWYLLCFMGTGILLILSNGFSLTSLVRGWPGRLPRRVAIFQDGIAWIEKEQRRRLTWQQIRRTAVRGEKYTVETVDGQSCVFAASLRRTKWGQALEKALPGPGKPKGPTALVRCPHCGETIAAGSTRCLFCMEPIPEAAGKS